MLSEDFTPIEMHPDACPWQSLPEMALDFRAERAGIEAGLRLVECCHHHAARRLGPRDPQAALARLARAMDVVCPRVQIAGAMQ